MGEKRQATVCHLQAACMVREGIERLYRDTCTVYGMVPYQKENRATAYQEEVILENQPCKLSYYKGMLSANPVAANDGISSAVQQTIKLFIAPELDLPPGSKIQVSHLGRTLYFKSSGVPAIFANHQEIQLELAEKWA